MVEYSAGKNITRDMIYLCLCETFLQLLYIEGNRSCLRSQVNPFLPVQTAYGKGGLHSALLVLYTYCDFTDFWRHTSKYSFYLLQLHI